MQIGINAMSSIREMKEDFTGAAKRLKNGGCDFIETMSEWGAKQETIDFYAGLSGGPSGWEPGNTEKRIESLKKLGMGIKGMFVFDELLLEQADDLGGYCRKNGIEYVVLTFGEYGGIDDIYKKTELIKNVSEILAKYDVSVLMHNHEHDLLPVADKDGKEKPIIQVFIEQCSKEELMLEIDTGWLVYAGVDAVKYVEENLDRIAVIHLKDIARGFEHMERSDIFVPCGQGVVDFPNIVKITKAKPDMVYVLDQDASKKDIIEDHITSIKYIKGLMMTERESK